MLSELRTGSLSPKNYYEICKSTMLNLIHNKDMAIVDAVRHLSKYLIEAHLSGKQNLAKLYESVQYTGNIIPRLYLMVIVGCAYMAIKDAPVCKIMQDIIEMSRGIQYPFVGFF